MHQNLSSMGDGFLMFYIWGLFCDETKIIRPPTFCATFHFLKPYMGAWAYQRQKLVHESKYHLNQVHNLPNQLASSQMNL